MAQTFLIAKPAKNSKGKIFRVVMDRAWDDMPWSFLVQVHCVNHSHGKMVGSWRWTHKVETREEAMAIFQKKVG